MEEKNRELRGSRVIDIESEFVSVAFPKLSNCVAGRCAVCFAGDSWILHSGSLEGLHSKHSISRRQHHSGWW